jgi:beta-lactamase class A
VTGLDLAGVPGTVSVWCGRAPGQPGPARLADVPHPAASLVKLPVLLAAFAELDPDREVVLHDEFPSAIRGRYRADRDYDNDEQPWQRLGTPVPVRWLAERMVVASSNLATDHLVELLGLPAVTARCPAGFAVQRPIGDQAAIDAGLRNQVTAAAVGALLTTFARTPAPHRAEVLAVLRRQHHRDGIPAGLPAGVLVGNKTGWVDGVRHDAALITPPDAPAYALVVCTTTPLADGDAAAVTRAIATTTYAARSALPG